MKSKVKNSKKVKGKYPKLMSNTTDGFVVLFKEPYNGVVIANETSQHELGYSSDRWLMEYFEEFNGKVILEN